MPYFVYVSRNGRIEPQRFDRWPAVEGKPLEVVQQHEISQDDMRCRLSFLIRKYPYVEKVDLT